MINKILIYGLVLFILVYMRINPGKNILCYIILFLIALVILSPVEGWSVSIEPSNDDNKISNFNIFVTDITLDSSSSDGNSLPEDILSKLPAKFYTDDDKIDNSKIKIELQFDYKFSTTQIEKLDAITADNFPGLTNDTNLHSYNNLLNMLMNEDTNLSGEGFQIKIAEMDGTTENNVVINRVFDDSNLKIKSGTLFKSSITKSDIIGTPPAIQAKKIILRLDLTEIYNSNKFVKDKQYSIFYNTQSTAGCPVRGNCVAPTGSAYQCDKRLTQTESCALEPGILSRWSGLAPGSVDVITRIDDAGSEVCPEEYWTRIGTCSTSVEITNPPAGVTPGASINCPTQGRTRATTGEVACFPSEVAKTNSSIVFPAADISITGVRRISTNANVANGGFVLQTASPHGLTLTDKTHILIGDSNTHNPGENGIIIPPGLCDLIDPNPNVVWGVTPAVPYTNQILIHLSGPLASWANTHDALDYDAIGALAAAAAARATPPGVAVGEFVPVINSVIKSNPCTYEDNRVGTCNNPCDAVQQSITASEGTELNMLQHYRDCASPHAGGVQMCSYVRQPEGICLPDVGYYDTKLCTKTGGTDNRYSHYNQDALLSYGTCSSNSFKAVDATSFTKWKDIEIKKDDSTSGDVNYILIGVGVVVALGLAGAAWGYSRQRDGVTETKMTGAEPQTWP